MTWNSLRDICDRLALMRGGKIVQIGKTADVTRDPDRRRAQGHEPCPPREESYAYRPPRWREAGDTRGQHHLHRSFSGHEPGLLRGIIRPALKEQAKTSESAITTRQALFD